MFGDPATNPKGWDVVRLADALTLKSGEFLPAKDMNSDGQYLVYGGNGISGNHDAYLFDEPKIVIGRVGIYCGAVHYTPPRSWITDNALYVASTKNGLLDQYLVAALRMVNLNQFANRSGQPLISSQRIANVPLPIPPVELQNAFEVAVEKINSLVSKRRCAWSETHSLFGSLVQRAFQGEL
jgi:type I restriction enzyme S subunit